MSKTLPAAQSYFWTKEWQEEERKAEEDIANGDVTTFDNVEEAIAFLRKE